MGFIVGTEFVSMSVSFLYVRGFVIMFNEVGSVLMRHSSLSIVGCEVC